ncbi:MAG: TerB family tellurite resistance protein [Chitinophagaceae bacterium]|nr:TerB family tellurite resistance protein [Chitinophagaceae bacterium]
MYKSYVTTQEEALCHLFFHCCLKDGVFKEPELDQISIRIVGLGLRSELNIKEEVIHYTTYKPEIIDEIEYLKYLINLINPVNELALYSHCLELMLSDSTFDPAEEVLTDKIASVLNIEEKERETIKKLMAQRKVVETDKIF